MLLTINGLALIVGLYSWVSMERFGAPQRYYSLLMFLVAGTSALCVLIGMIVSIFSYMVGKGVVISWGLIGAELIGIFIGSMIGPRTSKYIPDKVLKIIFVVLAFYVGLRYTTKGFLGYSIVPPF